MSDRRLVDDPTLSDEARNLLLAGRVAEPSRQSRDRLLGVLLPQLGVGPNAGDAGTTMADPSVAQVGAGAVNAGAVNVGAGAGATWASLGVAGVVAAGALYGAIAVNEPSSSPSRPAASTPALSSAQPPPAAPLAEPIADSLVQSSPSAPNASPHPQSSGSDDGARVAPTPRAARKRSVVAQEPKVESSPRRGTPTTSPPAGSVPQVVADSRLAEEVKMLDKVRSLLGKHQEARARVALKAYFERFPRAFLAPEAKRLQAQFCSDGNPCLE